MRFSFILFTLILFHISYGQESRFRLPIATENPASTESLRLTSIGEYGLWRTARPDIPGHLHTGVDIERPAGNHSIYPITPGVIISKRTDGPYAQLILEHALGHETFWTVYEHISDIQVQLYEEVDIGTPLARFFNNKELNQFGWQFNHFHFEVLKVQPLKIKQSSRHPFRFFSSYTLICYDQETLNRYFHNPIQFLNERL